MILAVPPVGSGLGCAVGEITALPLLSGTSECETVSGTVTVNGQPNIVSHTEVGYKSFYSCATGVQAPKHNKVNNFGVTYAAGSKLYNLGPVGSFVSHVYAVRGCTTANGCALTVCDYMVADCTAAGKVADTTVWVPIASGIVSLRAQYGRDTGAPPSGTIAAWNTTNPTGTGWQGVIAVRLALVARSSQFEKTNVTATGPLWRADAPGTADETLDISSSFPTAAGATAWKSYRYKLVQSIEPLRNMVWGQQLP
jgi:type IV pilus assembly protein PilW